MSGRLDWQTDGADWPNRALSRFVRAGDLAWHVQEAGSGPAVLLLHGTGASTHSFAGLIPLLAAHGRVIAVDLPGHGFTSAPRGGAASLPAMARLVAALLGDLQVAPAVIVGHSAGAAVALRLVLDQGLRPRGLIGINAALTPFPGIAGRLFPALARALFLNPFAAGLVAKRARDADRVDRLLDGTGSAQLPEQSRALYHRLFSNRHHVDATLGMMAKWDLASLWDDMVRLPVPLRLIASDGDRTVPPAHADRVAGRVPGAQAVHVPRLGHLAHEEDPQTLADWIEALSQALPPAQTSSPDAAARLLEPA
jgi:magnesium chelatase accessory protein